MPLTRITVFGGSGFVGRRLVERLVKGGAIVRIGVRHPRAAGLAWLPPYAQRIETVEANVLDEAAVRSAVRGAEAVINLVGILTERGTQTFEAIHVRGARHVAAAAREAGAARVIHFSALGVGRESPAAADRSKAAGEAAVREVFPAATVVRPSLVFGRGDHFFTRFAALAKGSPVIPLIGGGRTRFQPVHVEDVTQAVVTMLAEPSTRGETFELGGVRVYTFKQLLEVLFAHLHQSPLLVPVPFTVAESLAIFLQFLPDPPLSPEGVRLLKTDKVVTGRLPTLAQLGIDPTPLEAILPTYLVP